ncbi:hypothetical protein RJ55_04296 [Drechmeria coniospora]|nr:hypothetical protein RJ55_04296 [Drechmeria coniospora]
MEARSLASLNSLASNPPQYPEKPNEEKQEPVVLYISRVPGTRDVILSTFKPRAKSVTAEDVANSLYYVHLEVTPDVVASPRLGAEDDRQSSDDSASARNIPRKPLPGSARPLTPECLTSGHRLHPESRLQHAGRNRASSLTSVGLQRDLPPLLPPLSFEPADGLADKPEPPLPAASSLPTAVPSRKPLSPGADPSLVPVPREERESSADTFAAAESSPLRDKRLPPLPGLAAEEADGRRRSLAPGRSSRSPSPVKIGRAGSPADSPFTLTLIRRDPGSGSQWNVGRVSSRQLDAPPPAPDQQHPSAEVPAPPLAPSAASCPPIDIEIETSGYAKFRRMPASRSAEGVGKALAAARDERSQRGRDDVGVFFRQAVMGYSKGWASNLKETLQRMDQAARRGRLGHGRSASAVSHVSATSDGPPEDGQSQGQSMKPRGYTFASPWDGKCEFRTGTAGRSVQCRHRLYDGDAAVYNPLVAAQGASAPKSGATTVSELRFNLPTSDVLGERARGAKGQWARGNFGKLLRPPSDSGTSDDSDVASSSDPNLAGERLGGGHAGKRAKLGKLIVYQDGLKMLDLLVAANIGLWWGAWERTF